MSVENNKELVRRFYEALEQENYEALKDFCHKDFVFYPQVDTPFYGVEGFLESEKKKLNSFSDLKMSIKAMVAEGNQVAAYLIFEGKHTGIPFFGVPATRKTFRCSFMMLLRIVDGKIIEKRPHVDVHDVLRQLSA